MAELSTLDCAPSARDAASVRAGGAPVDARPRVVMVAASLDIIGGHGVQALELAQGLRKQGYGVSLLPVNPRFPRGLEWLRRIPYARTLVNQLLYLASLRRLREADVVHVFSASYWSFLLGPVPAVEAARRMGKRVVLHYHSGEAEDHLARWGRAVHPWLRRAEEIVVPSDYLRAVFARHGHSARVIPNVVDLGRFRWRDRSPLRPRLLSTRSLEPHYGVGHTLEAFALFRARRPQATLTLAGTGSEEAALRRRAGALGVADAVRFRGRVEPEDMPGLCDQHDVFVNSSLVDNQPVSLLEAFAAGLAVVTTPTGAIRQMVADGRAGLLVPAGDPAAMARALEQVLDDPEAARRRARWARREAAAHTWEHVRSAWSEAYGGPGPRAARIARSRDGGVSRRELPQEVGS
jgi:glycosyltransferase involved in cell wall biosynthesis